MTLYRRSKKPGANYYVQFFHNGRRIQYCTGKADYYEARTEAMRYEAEVKLGRIVRVAPADAALTVQAICDRYLISATHASEATRKKNVSCLKLILEASGYAPESSVSVLDGTLIKRYQAKMEAAKNSPVAINSTVRQARSVFSEKSKAIYADMGLPDVSSLMSQPLLREPRTHYVPPPAEAINLVAERSFELKTLNPSAYAGFVLAMYTGMRPNEVVCSRWEWVKSLSSGLVVEIPAAVAKSDKPRLIPISASAVKELREVSPMGGFILPGGTAWKRYKAVAYDLSAWLAALGVKRTPKGKTVYELRKYYGSRIATAHGLLAAQRMLGHSTPAVTAKHYAGLIDLPPPIEMLGATGG